MSSSEQQIVVYQQRGSGEAKIQGIYEHGRGMRIVRVVDIDGDLPPVLDDTEPYLPAALLEELSADLVLDFLTHPDLRQDLAVGCLERSIPVVASGKRIPIEGVICPPT